MKLLVRSHARAMVTDYYRLVANGVKAYIGWRFDPSLGDVVELPDLESPKPGTMKRVRQGGHVRIEEPVTISLPDDELGRECAAEYARDLAQGSLIAADDATAAFATERSGRVVKKDVQTPADPPEAVSTGKADKASKKG